MIIKTKSQRIKIIGYIKRKCKYCGLVKECIVGEIKTKPLLYCNDCFKLLYGISLKK